MKAKSVLVCSLVLNVALLGTLGWVAQNRKPPSKSAEQAQSAGGGVPVSRNEAVSSGPGLSSPSAAAEPGKPIQAFDWRLVESQDYKKYIANLRSIGCPEETIRDIIIADVDKLFASRKRALSGSTNKFEYWKTGNFFANIIDEKAIEQKQQLSKEKRELLKELLGFAPEEKPDLLGAMNPFESMLDFLPSAKQAEVAELFQKFQARIVKGFSGSPDGDDLKNMQKTQKEMETELAKVLSPEELEQYQLRMSQTAMMMRMQLASFEPNEQEFRDIFKDKKAFDDEFGAFGMLSQDKAEKKNTTLPKKPWTKN
jgi:hypothetical protein